MNLKANYLTALCILFTTTSYGYIPDLFGAYQRGAEMARQDNARDAYYYQQLAKPTITFSVYQQGRSQPKNNMNVSIKNKDSLCWILYNIPENFNTQTIERFFQPYDGIISLETSNNIIKQKRLSPRVIDFYRNVSSGNTNQIDGCWTFANENPKGTYYINLTIGSKDVGTRAFNVVD